MKSISDVFFLFPRNGTYYEMLTDGETMLLRICFELSILDSPFPTSPHTDGQFPAAQTIHAKIASGDRVGNDLGKNRPEGASVTARIARDASHVIALDDVVFLFLQSLPRTALDTGSLVTLATSRSEFSQLPQILNAAVVGMIKITARRLTLFALATNFKIDV
jgi:hypothetical protein